MPTNSLLVRFEYLMTHTAVGQTFSFEGRTYRVEHDRDKGREGMRWVLLVV